MFQTIIDWISHYGVWAFFPILFMMSLGLPAPNQSILAAGSLLAATGKMNLGLMLGISIAGTVLGNATAYILGRWRGRKLLIRLARLARINEKQLGRFENLLHRRGFWFIVAARFIVVARHLNGLIAGAGRMNFTVFMIANTIGAVLWVLAWGLGPYCLLHFF